ncbi:MAG: Gfo/Idh/MocA family oxidoreductase [Pseudomonadota bacterium]
MRTTLTSASAKLNIPYAGTDWQQALTECEPDIVSIGTPGGAHVDPIKQAIAKGCHVFCDKPLTESGATAKMLYEMAVETGVKTAFAATFRYMPHVLHAKRLVSEGAIGEPLEIECISHFNLERDIPFGWSHRKEDGGGRLNNNFTHKLSIVTSVVGEEILSIMGEVRDDLGRAPIVEGVHNFKTRRSLIPEDLNDPTLKWGKSNVEWSYAVLAQIESPFAAKPVSVLFKHGGLNPRFNNDHMVIYGSKGAIHIEGHYGSGPLFLYSENKEWAKLKLPEDIKADIPDVEGDTERNWCYLIREFLKDIQGQPVAPYQTFKEGSHYQQLIDIIRSNENWVNVSHLN